MLFWCCAEHRTAIYQKTGSLVPPYPRIIFCVFELRILRFTGFHIEIHSGLSSSVQQLRNRCCKIRKQQRTRTVVGPTTDAPFSSTLFINARSLTLLAELLRSPSIYFSQCHRPPIHSNISPQPQLTFRGFWGKLCVYSAHAQDGPKEMERY